MTICILSITKTLDRIIKEENVSVFTKIPLYMIKWWAHWLSDGYMIFIGLRSVILWSATRFSGDVFSRKFGRLGDERCHFNRNRCCWIISIIVFGLSTEGLLLSGLLYLDEFHLDSSWYNSTFYWGAKDKQRTIILSISWTFNHGIMISTGVRNILNSLNHRFNVEIFQSKPLHKSESFPFILWCWWIFYHFLR